MERRNPVVKMRLLDLTSHARRCILNVATIVATNMEGENDNVTGPFEG